MQLPTPLILEDWEDYLKGFHPEPGPNLPFILNLEFAHWPHEVAELFQRASPPRPYPHKSGSNPDEHQRMIWVLNGMRTYLEDKLQALVRTYCGVSLQQPLVGDEFIVTANEDADFDRRWAGVYVVKKRLIEHLADKRVVVRIILAELEWQDGVTGFYHS